MLYKHLISFVAGLAAVTSVAASIPQARDAYPPPNPPPIPSNQCSGTVQCCTTLTSVANPIAIQAAQNEGLSQYLDPNFDVGLSCNNIAPGGQCASNQVCCTHAAPDGTISLGCTPVKAN